MQPIIRPAVVDDVPSMVVLSYAKRRNYEKAHPQFWRYAEGAEEKQTAWFRELLHRDDHILLVAELDGQIKGFIIGKIIVAPEVYTPGGLTLRVDDFCAEEPKIWKTVGYQLITEIKSLAKTKGAAQILVVSGHHDETKKRFLKENGLNIASEWYVGEIE